jgi:hypothetical protein
MEENKLVHEILDEHFTMHFGRKQKCSWKVYIKSEHFRPKMVIFNKYDSVQSTFSLWHSSSNPKFKLKTFGMYMTTFCNSKFIFYQN